MCAGGAWAGGRTEAREGGRTDARLAQADERADGLAGVRAFE